MVDLQCLTVLQAENVAACVRKGGPGSLHDGRESEHVDAAIFEKCFRVCSGSGLLLAVGTKRKRRMKRSG